ncbi:MAG: HAD family hydrolase [Victivallaceae bacterium]|nr:HAD family hydrolase [Victivallaceae bacterium]
MITDFKNIRSVFFDIDNTIAVNRLGYSDVGYFEYVLAGIVCRSEKTSYAKALKTVLETEKKYAFFNPFLTASELKVAVELYRRELSGFQAEFLHIFEDAVELIKTLKAKGYDLYITSSNNRSRAYAVLCAGGVSDWERSEYFREVFGPDTIGYPKNSVDFYKKLIAVGKFRPEEMLIIGDDIESDCEMPRKAGIEHTVIIDRNKRLERNDIFVVHDLRNVLNKRER